MEIWGGEKSVVTIERVRTRKKEDWDHAKLTMNLKSLKNGDDVRNYDGRMRNYDGRMRNGRVYVCMCVCIAG
jgi:hypothetical protein